MRYFPVFLSLADRRVLLVGAGEAAEAKSRLLAAAGAEIVRADDCCDFSAFAAVFITSDDPACVALAARARQAGVPVNVVDRPDISTFIVPSIVDRGDVVVAVGTGGASPVLARRIRARIEALLPAGLGALAGFLGRNRRRAEGHGDRRALWEAVVDGPVAAAVLAGDEAGGQAMLDALLAGPVIGAVAAAVTFIPDASEDPDDLTLRAFRALQDADIVVHPASTAPAIVDRARRDARRATADGPAAALLRAEAAAGRRVVRLCADGATLRFEERALRAAGIPTIVAAAPHPLDRVAPRRVRPFQMAG